MKKPLILIADDDNAIRLVLEKKFNRSGFSTKSTAKGKTLLAWIENGEGDLVITDVIMEDSNGLELLPLIQNVRPNLPIIVMSGLNTIKTAIDASASGAYEYFPKPFDLDKVLDVVTKAFNSEKSGIKKTEAENILYDDMPIIGRSPAMQEVYRILAKVVASDLTVMIRGESGTGKELVARAIHDLSLRAKNPFLAINCGALTETLLDSELFGHTKGSFTGAESESVGLFEAADGGTLFLDEIGEMSTGTQVKLLRVLQDGEVRKIGATTSKKVNVRVITATHRDIANLVVENKFREDLFYRIHVFMIRTPTLKERKDDILLLAENFLQEFAQQQNKAIHKISDEVLVLFKEYSWPGNIRELRNIIERATVLCESDVLQPRDLPVSILNNGNRETLPGALKVIQMDNNPHKVKILASLEKNRWNKTLTAKDLNISRATLWRKIKAYSLLNN